MSRHQNSEQIQNIRIENESFENVAKFKYLGTTLTNQNDIHDDIKSRITSGNSCCYSVQNLLSLTLREEHRLRVFESRMLRRIFGPKRGEDKSWGKLHNDELHGLYSSPYIVRVIKSNPAFRLNTHGWIIKICSFPETNAYINVLL
jgi:hypothetical protein